jgi:hypothetical protein
MHVQLSQKPEMRLLPEQLAELVLGVFVVALVIIRPLYSPAPRSDDVTNHIAAAFDLPDEPDSGFVRGLEDDPLNLRDDTAGQN